MSSGRPRSVGQRDRQPAFLDAQGDAERAVMAGDVEMIAFEQVEDRDPPLLLDVGVALQDRALVELDVDDARFAHAVLLASAAFSRQQLVKPVPRHAGSSEIA